MKLSNKEDINPLENACFYICLCALVVAVVVSEIASEVYGYLKRLVKGEEHE